MLSDQVFVYIQSVQAYLSPPIFVAYFSGILWRRANAKGALSCLGFGYGLGFTRLMLEIANKEWCAEPESGTGGVADVFAYAFICSNFLYFGLISLFFCVTVRLDPYHCPCPSQTPLCIPSLDPRNTITMVSS